MEHACILERRKRMKTLAIDPSSRQLGIAVVEDDVITFAGQFNIEAYNEEQRPSAVIWELEKFEGQYDEIAMEQINQWRGRSRIFAIEYVALCIRRWAERNKKEIVLYPPVRWKSGVLGNPTAGKENSVWYVQAVYPELNVPNLTDHIADAICIGLYHNQIRKIERMAAGN